MVRANSTSRLTTCLLMPRRWKSSCYATLSITFVAWALLSGTAAAQDPRESAQLDRSFAETVVPFLKSHCLDCHGEQRQEAKLDLSPYTTVADVTAAHGVWEIVLERLAAAEMPPAEAKRQPSSAQRAAVVTWIQALRKRDAQRNAGDPGDVLARRLNNAEYNYTIRDLTHVDIRPTATFPVDPANEAGFDNSGESLAMSPALLNKYLDAARLVAEHLVLAPTEVYFAPHPVVTDTDRDKFCVKRIVEFYEAQPTDLSRYFLACWQYRRDEAAEGAVDAERQARMAQVAARQGLSPKYLQQVWQLLTMEDAAGPVAKLQGMFAALATDANHETAVHTSRQMRAYVEKLRPRLSPQFENLYIEGNHKGSQPFVLWKNGQYAAHRRTFDRQALYLEGEEIPAGTPRELVLSRDEREQARQLAALEQFCAVFPDAFYVSERGRDYLDIPRDQQEKGRLLSAGFHSMMGYYRDDGPLCELILDEAQRATLDRLWQELEFVASTAARQYVGFLWFERTDSRYMRDPEFDFARAEDKQAASEAMVQRLAEVYLAKARASGGGQREIGAIDDYFRTINAQLRWADAQRAQAEPLHVAWLLPFAARAWRRPLFAAEQHAIREFYASLRAEEGLAHEEAMRDSVVSILMSPHYLFRMDLASAGPGTRPLTGHELASRLSYFLWSSLPDEELLLAFDSSQNGVIDLATVEEQTRRMLADDRVRGLAVEFATNWLDVRRFPEHNSVDRERFPEFTDQLRQAMFEEPIRFFVDLAQHDHSVLELLDANHTFVNRELADHYGMTDLEFGNQTWIRVAEAYRYDRGGLLPMAVFLTKNSPGLRTSPVKRGYWVVRNLLGERIPPPPPNVPELPADEGALGEMSLREVLARHRAHASCAGCHDRFDGVGLAFEGYGPIGERRSEDLGGRPVEDQAQFPGGDEGAGLWGLRQYLRQHRQADFVDNLCRKMLSYALGRSLTLSDEPLIAHLKSELHAGEFRLSKLIEAIVTSRQFLEKRGSEQLVKEN